ncbi:LysR family transcriptional regulator substrate-binding protein, partial [Klebsiella pneumoniae]|uniref:LysR family transcriptional regulator substrate-binding protein n=1 Tax=Klebsiella pneumoniae TaxID=573 RepID=UPI0025A2C30F
MQYREHINKYLTNHGIKVNPAFEVDSSSILVNLVNKDYGLSFIPYSMAESSIKENRCFVIDLIEKIPERHIAFAIKKDGYHS